MKSQKLYREIGLIDEGLIEASEISVTNKKKIYTLPKWIACVLMLVSLSSVYTILVAKEYYENKSMELYMRYLTTEDLELEAPYKYDVDKFFKALKSDHDEYVYIAINRLVECFNNEELKKKALKNIAPLIESNNEKIAEAALFAVDILSEKYESPFVYKLSDGSIVFTLFNNYSDYGSQNVLWRIKDNKLEECLRFAKPSLYIKEIHPSPDGKLIAVVTCSNKSEFVQIINIEKRRVSPELIESARVRYGAGKGLETWIRTDYENYSYLKSIKWKENNILEFETILAYNDTQVNEEAIVTYSFDEKKMSVK